MCTISGAIQGNERHSSAGDRRDADVARHRPVRGDVELGRLVRVECTNAIREPSGDGVASCRPGMSVMRDAVRPVERMW
jgi:hypothetical protein